MRERRSVMGKKRLLAVLLAAAFAALLLPAVFFAHRAAGQEPRQTVYIAIPYNKYIYQPGTGYYTRWLEEQTGLDIEFVQMEEDITDSYLRLLFSGGAENLDAIFLPPGQALSPSEAVLRELGAQGAILPLEGYIDELGQSTKAMFDSFDAYDLEASLTDEDGHVYWLPNVSTAKHSQMGQTMWINAGWLKRLGLTLPQTTEEFRQVLQAFADDDPNGNGLADEVPLAGCAGNAAYAPQHFILNAFVYDDPRVAHLAMEGGELSFSPISDEWREGLRFLRGLYEDGLFPAQNFSFTAAQLEQLVNDPRDLVGCFTSENAADLMRIHSPDVLNRYVHLPPLKGPNGTGYAQAPAPQVSPGGLVCSQSEDPQGVFRLMDLMLSPEAALIAHFGEQDVDWEYAEPGDVTITGQQAFIHVRNNLSAGIPNQNLAQAGPGYLAADIADEIMWGGPLMEQLFMDGRAATAYQTSYPKEALTALLFPPGQQDDLQEIALQVTDAAAIGLEAFVTGDNDIDSEAAWQNYVRGFDALGLRRLLEGVNTG